MFILNIFLLNLINFLVLIPIVVGKIYTKNRQISAKTNTNNQNILSILSCRKNLMCMSISRSQSIFIDLTHLIADVVTGCHILIHLKYCLMPLITKQWYYNCNKWYLRCLMTIIGTIGISFSYWKLAFRK